MGALKWGDRSGFWTVKNKKIGGQTGGRSNKKRKQEMETEKYRKERVNYSDTKRNRTKNLKVKEMDKRGGGEGVRRSGRENKRTKEKKIK